MRICRIAGSLCAASGERRIRRKTKNRTTRVSGWLGEILSGAIHWHQTQIREANVRSRSAATTPEIVLPQLGIVNMNVIPVERTIGIEKPDPAVKIVRDFGIHVANHFFSGRNIGTGLLAARAARPLGVAVNDRRRGPALDR